MMILRILSMTEKQIAATTLYSPPSSVTLFSISEMSGYGSLSQERTASAESVAAQKDEKSPLIAQFSGEKTRSIWSKLTFNWFTPILERGNAKERLDHEDLDLIPLPRCCSTRDAFGAFERHWNDQLQTNNPSLALALCRAFGWDFALGAMLKLVHDLCLFVGPQVLHEMIEFLRDPNASIWRGLSLTVAVTLSQLMMSICLRHYFFKCYSTGLRVRTAIVVAVYRKSLALSASERQARSMGEITNLMSIDAQRLQDLTTDLCALWSSPLQILLSLFFLWRQLGPSSLGGVAVIVVMIPVTKAVAQWMGKLQKRLMTARDARVQLNAEVLGSMKVIKMQAWEESFQQRILQLRQGEMNQLFRYCVGTAFSRMLWTSTPLFVALATFAAYVWSGHELDVASALTALALFGILRFPLFKLPQTINSLVEAAVTLKRLRTFFLCDEHQAVSPGNLRSIGIELRNLSAAYDSKRPRVEPGADRNAKALADKDWEVALLKSQLADAERCIRELTHEGIETEQEIDTSPSLMSLSRINLSCHPGELVAIVGGVGCGKTSLLNAILGELRVLAGTASVRGKLAYFSQTPFIMNASIRQNILFARADEPVDEGLYQRALSSCALTHDLRLLPHGDSTEVGERGITLSGGQKARVALARAVYHQAEISIIDDALSAVDAHVAKQLFESVLLGDLLKPCRAGQQRILFFATNALQYLNHPRVDKIIVMQDGRIAEEGTFASLSNDSESVFTRFLSAIKDADVSTNLSNSGPSPVQRLSSSTAIGLKANEPELDPTPNLIKEESRQVGRVGLDVYQTWIRAAGGLFVPLIILLLFAAVEGMSVLSNWWLTYWSGHAASESQTAFLGIYALINLAAAVAGFFRVLAIAVVGLKASRALYHELLASVLHAPMSFFDTTPVGRLINRFSKDMYSIDEKLTGTLRTYLQTLFTVFSTITVIITVTPQFLLLLIPMLVFYLREQAFFTLTYRELKRLDSVNRSPLYALLGESIDGVAVIRSFSAQKSLVARMTSVLDAQQHAYYLTCTAQSWLALRLELVGTLIVTSACMLAIAEHFVNGSNVEFAALAGLSISYALSVTQSLNWSVRMASDMEATMVAVERVREYSLIESEGSRETEADARLSSWPNKGEIIFTNASLRYRKGLPLVLKGLDLRVPAGSKVGIVGRTGAGKSTLAVALLRIVDLDGGSVHIDGVDTRNIGLAKLRQKVAVVTQDPILFSGDIRFNLDPFHEFGDEQLYTALSRVGLYKEANIGDSGHSSSVLGARIDSLDDVVAENGSNFSLGQRQLIVIARALLFGSKILITDEATASVDAEMDASIQKVLRDEFAEATCLTVAHRLNTIMDSDYILVMDDGRLAEFDTPDALLKKGGKFRDLVEAASQVSNGDAL